MPMPLPPLSDALQRRSLSFDPPDPDDVAGRISTYRSKVERVGDVKRPHAPLCHCGLRVDGGCSDLDRRRRSFRQWRLRQARDPRGSRRIARRTGGRSRQAPLRLAGGWHLSRAARQRARRGRRGQVGSAGVLAGFCSMPTAAAIAILPAGSTASRRVGLVGRDAGLPVFARHAKGLATHGPSGLAPGAISCSAQEQILEQRGPESP
jgi:hypothetical protein